jgi:hypothetical protein
MISEVFAAQSWPRIHSVQQVETEQRQERGPYTGYACKPLMGNCFWPHTLKGSKSNKNGTLGAHTIDDAPPQEAMKASGAARPRIELPQPHPEAQ